MNLVPKFLCACVLLIVTPAAAHHTFVSKYDSSKTVDVAGTIETVSYTNPHIFFSVSGWTVETESLSIANAKGLKASLLKAGAKVRVTGWPARDGGKELGLKSISFQDGPTITMRRTAR